MLYFTKTYVPLEGDIWVWHLSVSLSIWDDALHLAEARSWMSTPSVRVDTRHSSYTFSWGPISGHAWLKLVVPRVLFISTSIQLRMTTLLPSLNRWEFPQQKQMVLPNINRRNCFLWVGKEIYREKTPPITVDSFAVRKGETQVWLEIMHVVRLNLSLNQTKPHPDLEIMC